MLVQEPSAPERDRLDTVLRKRIGLASMDSDTVVAGQLPSRSLYDYCFVPEDASWKVSLSDLRNWICGGVSGEGRGREGEGG